MGVNKIYDTIILGAGPAGLSAAVYATRYSLKTLVIGKGPGLMTEAHEIENYLGFKKVSGAELDKRFLEHAESLGAEVKREEVLKIEKNGETFTVTTDRGKYESKTLIYALGGIKRKLNVPSEKKFRGRGISYCATCDAAFFKDKIVAVTGGSDSAAMSALLLAKFAKKVYIIYRRGKLRAFPSLVEKIGKTNNIETIYNTVIKDVKGENLVEGVVLEYRETGETSELQLDGIFVEYGHEPNSYLAEELGVKLSEKGRIVVGEDMSTSISGFFAAGDITTGSDRFDQIITAAAEGSIAAKSAHNFISR